MLKGVNLARMIAAAVSLASTGALMILFRVVHSPADNLPIVLSAIGIVLIVISGWLGGELVYARGVAVKQPPDESI